MSEDLDVRLRLSADGKGLVAVVRDAKGQVQEIGKVAQVAGAQADAGMGRAEEAVQAYGRAATVAGRQAAAGMASANAGIQSINRQMGRLQSLGGAWAALAGARAATRELLGTADAITSVNARLRLATDGQKEYAQAQSRVIAIADRTRTSIESVGTLYVRLTQASDSLGFSQQKVADLTSAVSTAVRLSGGSSATAAAGVQQLAQAFASGVLSGDEFRSVMENSPRLVMALTASTGASVGELRKLAEQQKLTADIVAESILLQKEKLEAELTAFPATVSASMQQIDNAWSLYVDGIMNASGETSALAGVMKGVTDLLMIEAEAAKNGGGGLDVLATAMKGVIVVGVTAKNAVEVIATTVAGLQTIAVTVVSTIYDLFQNSIRSISEYQERLLSLDFEGAYNAISSGFSRQVGIVKSGVGEIDANLTLMKGSWDSAVADTQLALEKLNQSYEKNGAASGANAKATEELQKRIDALQARIKGMLGGTESVAEATKRHKEEQAKLEKQLRATTSAFTKFEDVEQALSASIGGAGVEAAQAYADQMRAITVWEAEMLNLGPQSIDMINRVAQARANANEVLRRAKLEAAATLEPQDQMLKAMRQEQADLLLTNEQREISNALREMEHNLIQKGIDPMSELGRSYLAQAESAQRVTIATRTYAAAVDETKGIVVGGFGSMADALGDFAIGGIKSFSDFGKRLGDIAKRMVADLIAQFLKLRVIQPLLNGLFNGGASGGGWASILGNVVGGSGASGTSLGGGAAMPWMGALAGAAYGAQNPANNGFGTAARVGTYAYTGWALGTVAYGAALGGAGAAAGAGIGAAAGGAATGAMGAAAAIPVVGWIVAALALIDAVSGGKLFGTKYKAASVTQGLNINALGGTAQTELYETRQAALFGGIRRRTRTVASSPEAREAAQSIFERVQSIIEATSQQLKIEAPDVFEAAIRTVQKLDKKGKVKSTEIFVDLFGRTWKEATQELAVTRLDAEALIYTLDTALAQTRQATADATAHAIEVGVLGGIGAVSTGRIRSAAIDMMVNAVMIPDDGEGGPGQWQRPADDALNVLGEASRIAERWRSDAEMLLEGAQFLVLAQDQILKGNNLLGETGTLTQVADLVEDLQRGDETLSQTFVRLLDATTLLRDAAEMTGVTFAASGQAFVELASDVVDAAGGLDQARNLWNAYFENFYTQAERAALAQQRTDTAFADAASELGLSTTIDSAGFRAAFEAALPTLTADQIVQWLNFAGVLAQVEQQRSALQQAEQNYSAWLQQMTLAVSGTPTAFQSAMMEIQGAEAQFIADANALAIARGQEGASVQDLALIHRWAAQQVKRAIAELEDRARGLVDELGYGQLATIEAQIAQLEASGHLSEASIQSAGNAAENFFEQFEEGLLNLSAYLDSMLLGELSPLSPEEQLAESRRQLQATAEAAQRGDLNALNQLQGLTDQFLRMSQSFNASGADYGADFDWARSLLAGITNPYGSGGQGAVPGTVELVPSEQLLALYAQRDALSASDEAARRAALAMQLSAYLVEVSGITRETVFAAAERMGVTFSRFVTDLGGDVTAETAEAVAALGVVANTLNVELPAIAQQLNLSIGELTDAQSLINDAFELQLGQLPEGFRSQIEPALRDLENASSTEEATAALERLNALTNDLPEEFRLALAPYLANVNPIDASTFTDLTYLSTIDTNMASAKTSLIAILAELRGTTTPPPVVGDLVAPDLAKYVTATSPVSSDVTRSNSVVTDPALLEEMRALRSEVVQLRSIVASKSDENTRAVLAAGSGTETAIRGLTGNARTIR